MATSRRQRPRFLAAAAALLLLGAGSSRAADWPHFRGPQRNGISAETGIAVTWPAGGPRKAWTAQVGQGYSAVSVVGNRLYTAGNSGGQDHVTCLDAATGRQLWRYSYPAQPGDYGGPRATPAVSGGRVYMLSREGNALCLDAATGRQIWWKMLRSLTNAVQPRWGFASSPVVVGSLVIFNVGATGTALNKDTGAVAWKSGGLGGYSSAVPFQNGRAVAMMSGEALVAVEATTGRKLWEFPWQTQFAVNAADPVFAGDTVFISSNYGKGCALLRLGAGAPTVVWQNRNMRNHFNSSVIAGGAIYGNDENTLKCLDLATGQERWRQRGMDKGGLILAAGHLLVLTGRGELWSVRATPASFQSVATARILSGETWTAPVLSRGRLYCRNQAGELVCLQLSG
jgi:outer membrane protein assembly factor BamB